MSLYNVTIGKHEYKVNITGQQCTVNGEVVDASVLPLNPNGLHLLRRGKQAVELFLSVHDINTYQMMLFGGRRIVTRVATRTKKHKQAESNENQSLVLTAPMHGLVIDVSVLPGDYVKSDQTLIVLESMKMQMQLRSPRDGKVNRIAVKPGSQVTKGALLVQFEQ
jgi:biotin carboxyl carrier protein